MRAALVLVLLTGCSAGGIGENDVRSCLSKYSVTAKASKAAEAAMTLCAERYEPSTTRERQAFIDCALPELARVQSDSGADAALYACSPESDDAPAEPAAPAEKNPYDAF